MAILDRQAYLEALPSSGSHFNQPVVLLSDHRFYATPGGTVFPQKRRLGWQVCPCDPLERGEGLDEALESFERDHAGDGAVFVAVNEEVAAALAARHYRVLKLGEEPWVDLADCEPRGNRGKGIRAARNQALRAGCTVETWGLADMEARRPEIQAVYREWQGLTLLSLEGGILGTDPFANLPGRRFFVALRQDRVEAVLVATAIREGHSAYLEDLVYRRDACRGVQELLTVRAMEALRDAGYARANLGLVLLRKPERGHRTCDPELERAFAPFRALIAWGYNAEGQDLFRKRFQVATWQSLYLACRGPRCAPGEAPRGGARWTLTRSLASLFLTLEPKLRLPW